MIHHCPHDNTPTLALVSWIKFNNVAFLSHAHTHQNQALWICLIQVSLLGLLGRLQRFEAVCGRKSVNIKSLLLQFTRISVKFLLEKTPISKLLFHRELCSLNNQQRFWWSVALLFLISRCSSVLYYELLLNCILISL